jgi:hypothetical protein
MRYDIMPMLSYSGKLKEYNLGIQWLISHNITCGSKDDPKYIEGMILTGFSIDIEDQEIEIMFKLKFSEMIKIG